jgi:hypothetical protein
MTNRRDYKKLCKKLCLCPNFEGKILLKKLKIAMLLNKIFFKEIYNSVLEKYFGLFKNKKKNEELSIIKDKDSFVCILTEKTLNQREGNIDKFILMCDCNFTVYDRLVYGKLNDSDNLQRTVFSIK